jgi:hypothetical protein
MFLVFTLAGALTAFDFFLGKRDPVVLVFTVAFAALAALTGVMLIRTLRMNESGIRERIRRNVDKGQQR